MSSIFGKLWVVATPLGNLGDFSPRAKETLEQVDLILAEDTRRTANLLMQTHTSYAKLTSFHEYNEEKKLQNILQMLHEGAQIALVSDAGTPLVSDPGFKLIRRCRKEHISVLPVPGPSAPIVALSVCGIAPIPFTFLGFLPRKESELNKLFISFKEVPTTLVFFERKDRVKKSLALAFTCLGDREYTVARELTKTYEEFLHGTLANCSALPDELLGEITVVVGPPQELEKVESDSIRNKITFHKGKGLKAKDLAKLIAEESSGWSAKEIYQFIQKEYHE